MLLYHGSTLTVHNPVVSIGRPETDFGKGFYTTTSREQAEKWAHIRKDRENKKNREDNKGMEDDVADARAIVSVYEFDEALLDDPRFKTLLFDGATVEWLDFVVDNRRGRIKHDYDIIQGPVANDKLYATISLYENGILDARAAIEQLKTHVLFDQVSFHSRGACSGLRFVESFEV